MRMATKPMTSAPMTSTSVTSASVVPGTAAPPLIADELAVRCSAALVTLWSPEHKVVLERQLWLEMLRAQAEVAWAYRSR